MTSRSMIRILSAFIISCVSFAVSAQTDSVPPSQSVGLVLSGGGAKGIAHIGVIKALEDNDIPIDYITGTSMGAIVGGLYASGFTPEEMMALIESKGFADWSMGTIDRNLTYYFLQEQPTPAMLNINLGERDSVRSVSLLPSSLINPLPMNFAFMELFAPYTAQCGGDFNKLFVPYRAVASDITEKRKRVCASGSLGDAIRASMSFPLVFHPIEIDGHKMYDGGIYDNFPVDVMRDAFAPQFMIGVDVSASGSKTDSNSIMEQLEMMIMQHSDYRLPERYGIKMRINLDNYGLLDFAKAKEIYRRGYDMTVAMMDSIKGRVRSRIPSEARRLKREVFKSQTPYLRFDSVSVTGGTANQDAYIHYLFTHNRPDTFGIANAREAYYRAITPGKISNLMPAAVFNDSTRLFSLDLRATMKDKYSVGIGGFLTTSTNSMLFLSGAYRTLSFNSLDMRLNGWVGQSYLAGEVSAQIRLLRATPSSLQVQAVASRQKYFPRDRFFFQTNEHTLVTADEYFGRLTYGVAAGNSGKVSLAVGYGHTVDKYYHEASELNPRYHELMEQNLAHAVASYENNTLNVNTAPTAGSFYNIKMSGAIGQHYFSMNLFPDDFRERTSQSWLQAEAVVRHYWALSQSLSLGAELNVVASTRKLLHSYTAAITDAPAYIPSPSMSNVFLPEFRANSYGALGVVPVWRMSSMLQLRGMANVFVPLRPILRNADGSARYGDYCSRAEFFGQLEAMITLPFGNVSAYGHYSSVSEGKWNFGLTFGIFIQAPKFLR